MRSNFKKIKRITVSIGVATESPKNKQEGNRLLSMADKSLYQSKAKGQNLVTPFSQD